MEGPTSPAAGLASIAEFALGFAAECWIADRVGVFTGLGVGIGIDNDPGVVGIGMTFDGAYKLLEKKGDVPALSAYAGLGFVHIDTDPKNFKSDSATDFVFEF